MAKEYLDKDGLLYFWQKIKNTFALATHTHTKNQITDFPVIPSKTSDLTNDSNFVSDSSYVHTDNNYTTTEKNKLSGIAAGAEVNQNAFSNVKVGSTTVAADGKTDTLELVAGSNVTLTPDATNDKVTIAATDTTYSDATTSASGLMSSTDKSKLDGIASGAEVNQNAFSVLKYAKNTDATSVSTRKTASAKTDDFMLVGGGCVEISSATKDNVAGLQIAVFAATESKAGYLSAADKTKLNKLVFDGNNLIDSSILPSYVDDVIEAYPRSGQTELSSTWLATGSASGTVITPETGKIYVLMADSTSYAANTQFRWSGSAYVKLADGGVSSITNAEIDTIVAS